MGENLDPSSSSILTILTNEETMSKENSDDSKVGEVTHSDCYVLMNGF